ncbi:hypothetical protein B0H13DRAFT_2335993 [Mycena leptocephala]|nr:hypothetical protein B0H13DRAFT_2335993 [Mycena leptocephala]
MPPPTKPMEEAVVLLGDKRRARASFDYTQLEPTGASDSVSQQKESFNKATKEERAKLEDKYPIGSYPNFPDRRVYLTRRLPPASRFFDVNQRIKIIPAVAAPAPAPAVVAPPALPALPLPASSSLSLSDLLLASLLGGGGIAALLPGLNIPGLPAPQLPAPAPAPAPASNPVPHLRSTPPSPVKRHTVPLDRFCEIYALDTADAALLKSVGFRPGDHTGPTLDEQLAKFGFTYFS